MRKIFIICTFLIVATAAATARADENDHLGWDAFTFPFSEAPGQAAIADLQKRQDAVLAKVMETDSDFAKTFPETLARFTQIALRSIVTPWILPTSKKLSPKETTELISHAFGKTIKNLQIFALENAVRESAKNYDGESQQQTYRYCEINADSKYCISQGFENNSLNWAITRRLVSSAQFVRAACPLVKSYVTWDLQWKSTSQDDQKQISEFLYETKRMLEFIYGDGTWSLNRIDSFKTDFDPGFFEILVRRYMDGGPEFIEATLDCLSEIIYGWSWQIPLKKDERASSAISGILQFNDVSLPQISQTFELQTNNMDYGAFYRLMHRWTADQPLPPEIYFSGQNSPTYHQSAYLDTLIGISGVNFAVPVIYLPRLLWQMNLMDPSYRYRSISRDEFTALFNAGLLPKDIENLCIVEGSLIGGDLKFYFGNKSGAIHEEGWACSPSEIRFVREVLSK